MADDRSDLRDRVAELEATVEQQQATIQQLLPSRRRVLQAGGLLAGGGVLGALTADRASADVTGQVGTSQDRVDVFAGAVDANSVNTDEGTIGAGSDAPRLATRRLTGELSVIASDGDVPGSIIIFPSGSSRRSHYLLTNNPDADNFGFVELEINTTSAWLHGAQKGTGTAPTDFRIYGFPDGIELSNDVIDPSGQLHQSLGEDRFGHEMATFLKSGSGANGTVTPYDDRVEFRLSGNSSTTETARKYSDTVFYDPTVDRSFNFYFDSVNMSDRATPNIFVGFQDSPSSGVKGSNSLLVRLLGDGRGFAVAQNSGSETEQQFVYSDNAGIEGLNRVNIEYDGSELVTRVFADNFSEANSISADLPTTDLNPVVIAQDADGSTSTTVEFDWTGWSAAY